MRTECKLSEIERLRDVAAADYQKAQREKERILIKEQRANDKVSTYNELIKQLTERGYIT